MYKTAWRPDCRRARAFLKEQGVAFQEVNIEEDPESEEMVMGVNHGRRKAPTLKTGERYCACSPFNGQQLADELKIHLNS